MSMADSWFDNVDQPPAPERSDAPRAQAMSDNDGTATKHKTAGIVALVLVFVVIVGAAIAYLVNGSNAANEQVNAAPAPSVTTSPITDAVVPQDPDAVIGVAGDCKPEDGEVAVTANDDTVRGAVAQWQTAYYSRDVDTLISAIAPDSWLLDNDWPVILEEAAPDGTTWCAVMSPLTSPDVVDVDVTVSFADGTSETYPQRVTGVLAAEHWLIADIEPREE
jgi:hypothetical protein